MYRRVRALGRVEVDGCGDEPRAHAPLFLVFARYAQPVAALAVHGVRVVVIALGV